MTHSVVEDLARLIAYPTVSDRPVTELAAFVARRLEALGFRVELVACPHDAEKCNLFASIGPEGTDGLVLSGHMDVVPTENQPWSSDPFKLREHDGKLYGRGTADMKGFLAAVLQALEGLPLDDLTRELVLIWTHDEEVGCLGSAHLREELQSRGRVIPSACLIGEPTSFNVLRMHPGHVRFDIEIDGEAAHSSLPHLGRNAIETAAEAVLALRDLAATLREERDDTLPLQAPWVPLNTAIISGGSAVNIVPDRCRLQVGYRPLPGMDADAVYHRAKDLLEHRLSGAPCGLSMKRGTATPSLLTPRGTDLSKILDAHARPGPESAPFATDGGHLAHLGTQPLIFGPGSIDVAHKADEYIDADELIRTIPIIRDVIRRRCIAPPINAE